jgi:hypothetical protein
VGIKSIYEVTDVPWTATSLDMTIKYDEDTGTISISSCPYLECVLVHYGMADCNPESTPPPVIFLMPFLPCRFRFYGRQAVLQGCWIHPACSKYHMPDIAYSVNCLAAFLQNPGLPHLYSTCSCTSAPHLTTKSLTVLESRLVFAHLVGLMPTTWLTWTLVVWHLGKSS